MKQASIINIVDILSFVALVMMISTGTLLEFTLPTRSGGASVWGLTRHQWGDLHFYISVMFLTLMSAHLITHIRYIKYVFMGSSSREQNYRLAIGMVGLSALLALAVAPVVSTVDNTSSHQGYHGGRGW